ncbi:ornithine cyclodeaminase family protein [Pontibacter sp. G13]|uniref:ornithine cyclodeaminase family protein n=1 Tax=Pontibacter sp. G13 TaxID=3074898 RepID=UPI00288A8382|nr:ornithine cyclodeaminase family protein [Pontibacter sp. G13]WNJ20006.1 ornithine cyclodeaminase family protein [Pontibacter sp. G13]
MISQLTEADLALAFSFPKLIEALRTGFTESFIIPQRMHLDFPHPGGNTDNTLLLMPAVQMGQYAGVKIVQVSPENRSLGLPTIQGIYYLLDAVTGVPKALMDAKALTNWRTAAASALAADYLARPDSEHLLMVGTGALAPFLIEAHQAVRPLRHLTLYGRSPDKAAKLARRFSDRFESVEVVPNLSRAVQKADIISVATMSESPLILGEWLQNGQHLDLVGAFKPTMRESNDAVMTRADVYVDSLEMAPKEAGDLSQPIAAGIIQEEDLKGDLFGLCRGEVSGRMDAETITVFKSVGHALEDLVAARLVVNG